MPVDMNTFREGVLRGRNGVFAQKGVLNALIKGDDKTRQHILKEITLEHFNQSGYKLVFEAIIDSLQVKGRVDKNYLYQKIEVYVREEVVKSYIDFINRILAQEIPNTEAVSRAISCLQKSYTGGKLLSDECFTDSEQVIIVALIKGDKETQNKIITELSADHFEINFSRIFEWADQLLQNEGKIELDILYKKEEDYVINKVMPTYTGIIDNVLAIEMFDTEMLDEAIDIVKSWQSMRQSQYNASKNIHPPQVQ